ncbi:MAG: class I SAM-dependent methyltransferase [Burkholderia contaminans]|uniref:rRNA adenine N-6-methyltransferase family protein n=1 Tax=Burkholderia contaminans TaxID=488447 RepID=A0AAP4VG19_9BURK|nr:MULTISPECIES: rRNA adenine N-6-methyltransferase family protein [Burkholderia]MBD1415808.1 methyltransferase domain-containing protein [Burkholderia contaminans]MBH9667684.1 methyltransferase domain-containing protein [Burkholderia contaminans]MBH9675046.1 methyltransferase domain-containing protein [Burkholderia contaminans]MBH9704950.1 methyltransferase domain-containing protein [Burkholderia contaminans]MBH9722145.1 methyltransferase domain-containing protein [Burkholderia contaminans]
MRIPDWMLFLRTWLRHPRRVGALAPSGPALAALITADIPRDGATVIELGAGTGVFTRALLARGVTSDRLVLVEADPAFANTLRHQFPALRVMQMDAAQLGMTGDFFGGARADAIVSGLPLVAMPVERAVAIVRCAFARHLAADGAFYQFTYVPRCPIPARDLEAMRIRAVRVGVAWMNFPPAIVYRFDRRIDAAGHQRPVARPLRDAVVEAAILRGFDAMPSLDSSGMRPSTEGSASS